MTARFLAAATLLAGLVAGGCSGYRAPGVVVVGATVTERSDEAVALDLALELTNPNDEPLELVQFDYDVALDGRDVFRGRWSAETTLEPGVVKTMRLPAVVRYDRLATPPGPESRCSVAGALLYVTPGELAETLLDTGVRRPSVSFSGAAPVSLPAAP